MYGNDRAEDEKEEKARLKRSEPHERKQERQKSGNKSWRETEEERAVVGSTEEMELETRGQYMESKEGGGRRGMLVKEYQFHIC